MELELVASIGVVINGIVAQVLAYLAATRTIAARLATERATLAAAPRSGPGG